MTEWFETEGEVVEWIKKKRAERPWITEVGLVEAAYAMGVQRGELDADTAANTAAVDYAFDRGYDAGYSRGYADGAD